MKSIRIISVLCTHLASLEVSGAPRLLPAHLYPAKQDFGSRRWDFISKTYVVNLRPTSP